MDKRSLYIHDMETRTMPMAVQIAIRVDGGPSTPTEALIEVVDDMKELFIKLGVSKMTDALLNEAGPDGFTLYVKGMLYSKAHELDGLIPKSALPVIGACMKSKRQIQLTVKKLIELQLFFEENESFFIPEDVWNSSQTSRADIDEKRIQARNRQQKHRERKNVTVSVTRDVTQNNAPRDKREEIREIQSKEFASLDEDKISFHEFWELTRKAYPSRGQGEIDATDSAMGLASTFWTGADSDQLEDFLGAVAFLARWAKWKEADDKTWKRKYIPSLRTWIEERTSKRGGEWLDLERMAPKDAKGLQTATGFGPGGIQPPAFVSRAPVEGHDFGTVHGRVMDLGSNEPWDEEAWRFRQRVIWQSENQVAV